MFTRTICSVCNIGLCSKKCFEDYHLRHGFVLVPAARLPEVVFPEVPPRRVVSRPENVAGPSSTVSLHRTSGDPDSESSSGEGIRHKLETKPPTPRKKYPQLRCRQCTFERRVKRSDTKKRSDTRYLCKACDNTGLCSKQCFDNFHSRMGIDVTSPPADGDTQSNSSRDISDTASELESGLSEIHSPQDDQENTSAVQEPDTHISDSTWADQERSPQSASELKQSNSPEHVLPPDNGILMTSEQSEPGPSYTGRVLRASTIRQRSSSPIGPLDLRIHPLDLRNPSPGLDLRIARCDQPNLPGEDLPPRKRGRTSESSDDI